ncbi:MAG: transcriptional regulator, TetR family [Acidobacteria bacterium]|nr:transcriptional regulator, TetR family [Acidobacteriota bacterium]
MTPTAGRHHTDTRARIVEAARFLFWDKGYAATGLAELLARAGANSGSFYHFFDSKDAVLRTVLETYSDLLEPLVLRPAFAGHARPIERIFALLAGYRERLVSTECQYGCPIGRLALELDPENAPAHALIARNFTAWRAAVEGCVRDAGIADAVDVAAFVLTVMEGAVMQSRAYRSIEPYDACVRQLRLHLTALAPPKPTPKPARTSRRSR